MSEEESALLLESSSLPEASTEVGSESSSVTGNLVSNGSALSGVEQYGSDEEEGVVKEEEREEKEKEIDEEEKEEVEQEKVSDEQEDDSLDDDEEPPIKIVEGGLNFVLKHFDGIGDFYGLIISFDQPYFRVVYEDSDCEELEVHEVEELLVSMLSVPEDIISSLKKIAKTISIEGVRNEEEEEEEEEEMAKDEGNEKQSKVEEWKTFVLKSFGDMGDFYGMVIHELSEEPDEEPLYKVVYEDGDIEDLEFAEVMALIVPANKVNAQKKKLLKGFAKSSTAAASPSDFRDTTSSASSKSRGRGGGKRKVGRPPATSPKPKAKSTPESSGTAGKKRPRDDVVTVEEDEIEVDEDEGATVPKRLLATGVTGWKYYVLKSFDDLGDFYGLVVSHEKPYYKVVYEDGDSEEVGTAELKPLLVPANSVSSEKKKVLWDEAVSVTGVSPPSDVGSGSAGKNKGGSKKKAAEKKNGKRSNKAKSNSSSLVTLPTKDQNNSASSGDRKKHRLLDVSEAPLVLQEPVDTYDNYVSKTFFGFGVFYGLLVSCQLPYYKVLYSDGDSEEQTFEEVQSNLVSPSVIPTKIRNILRSLARTYKQNPVPYQNQPLCESSSDENAAASLSTYRDVPEDNIYQQYVGRTFIDMDENITFRIQSVCLHMDYDVLLFKYYDEYQFLCNPEYFNDQDKFEYSACSEMLKIDSWCKWVPEQQKEEEKTEDQEGGEVMDVVDEVVEQQDGQAASVTAAVTETETVMEVETKPEPSVQKPVSEQAASVQDTVEVKENKPDRDDPALLNQGDAP